MRPSWDEYFIEIASVVAKRGTCIRRVYGAVIVKDNIIVSTGYCGAPRGEVNCCDVGVCERQRLNIPSGERYELCKSVHAEANAIIQGDSVKMKGSTIYISGWVTPTNNGFDNYTEAHPCMMCMRMIKNAKIEKIIYRTNNGILKQMLIKDL